MIIGSVIAARYLEFFIEKIRDSHIEDGAFFFLFLTTLNNEQKSSILDVL